MPSTSINLLKFAPEAPSPNLAPEVPFYLGSEVITKLLFDFLLHYKFVRISEFVWKQYSRPPLPSAIEFIIT